MYGYRSTGHFIIDFNPLLIFEILCLGILLNLRTHSAC